MIARQRQARLREQRGRASPCRSWTSRATRCWCATFRRARRPCRGATRDALLKGKLAFFTALGIPDNGLSGLGIRDIVPLAVPGQAVGRRLEHLRILPPVRARGRRDLDLRRRAAERDRDGRPLLQDQRRARHPHQQLERGARQRRPTSTTTRATCSAARASPAVIRRRCVAGRTCRARTPGRRRRIRRSSTTASRRARAKRSTCRPTWVQTIRPLNQPKPADTARSTRARRLRGELRFVPRRRQVDEEPGLLPEQPGLNRHRAAESRATRAWSSRANQIVSYADAAGRCRDALLPRRRRHLQRRRTRSRSGARGRRPGAARRGRLQQPDAARRQLQRAVLPRRRGADARGGLRSSTSWTARRSRTCSATPTRRTSCLPPRRSTAARRSSSRTATSSRIRPAT